MIVPKPLSITPSLRAGATLSDGSVVECGYTGPEGGYLAYAYGPQGEPLVEGEPVRFGVGPRSWGEVVETFLAFVAHDAEVHEFSRCGSWGSRYPQAASELEEEALIFSPALARWADDNRAELDEIRCALAEGQTTTGEVSE